MDLGHLALVKHKLISFLQHISQSNNQNIQTDVVIMDLAKAW